MRPALLSVAVVAALCGCGSSGERGHLSREGATEVAMNAVGVELRSPQSALHGHRVRLLGVTEGVSATGDEAWIARIRDTTEGEDFCVRVWIQSAVLGTTQHVEFGRCGSRVPSLRPTVTTQSSIG